MAFSVLTGAAEGVDCWDGGVLTGSPLLGRVGGMGLALLGRVVSLTGGAGVRSQGNCATLRPESFFCHSWINVSALSQGSS